MNRWQRLLLVLVILLSGFALVPFVALPSEQLTWQRYANAYQQPYTMHLPIMNN